LGVKEKRVVRPKTTVVRMTESSLSSAGSKKLSILSASMSYSARNYSRRAHALAQGHIELVSNDYGRTMEVRDGTGIRRRHARGREAAQGPASSKRGAGGGRRQEREQVAEAAAGALEVE
jgi:hypothetical protein